MTLSPSLVNAMLSAGMVLDLILMVLVLRALRSRRQGVATGPRQADAVEHDLEERVNSLSASTAAPLTARIAPLMSSPLRPESLPRTERPISPLPPSADTARGSAGALPPSARLALPESGRLTMPAPESTQAPHAGLDPLAARFSGSGPEQARVTAMVTPPLPGTRPALPPTAPTGEDPPIVLPDLPAQPPLSNRFTEIASNPVPPPAEAERTPVVPPQTRGLAMPTERLAARADSPVPGIGQWPDPAGAGGLSAILRGESATLVGAADLGSDAPIGMAAARTVVTSVPAADPVPAGLRAPLGAAPFMATRFRSDDPVSIAVAAGQEFGDLSPFAQDLPGGSGAIPGLAPLAGLQVARMMEDFDLPDTGFETHVFSTTELIDEDPLASTLAGLPSLVADDAPQGGESRQAEVQEAMAEIAAVPEVTGAYLLRQDGSTLAATDGAPLPGSVLAAVDALLQAAMMEGKRLNLGECGSVAVELPESALLLSPVAARVGLVVSVVDSSRLMPVRRLLRKPLGTLRAAFVAHDLS